MYFILPKRIINTRTTERQFTTNSINSMYTYYIGQVKLGIELNKSL